VEGSDEWRACGRERGQADRRDHRFMEVDDVVTTLLERLGRFQGRPWAERDADGRAVVADWNRPSDAPDPWRNATTRGRSQHVDIVATLLKRPCESEDVCLNAARDAEGVGTDERDPHILEFVHAAAGRKPPPPEPAARNLPSTLE
jgi:hypothetical protein